MSCNKKKIAILGIKTYPAFLGADRVFENIINRMDGEFDYFIYLIKTDNAVADHDNKHFVYLPALRGKHMRAFSFYVLCTLHMLLMNTYDLIHAHNSDVGLFTFLLNLRYKKRIVGTFHGEPYKSTKWGKFAKLYLKASEWLFIRSCHQLTSVSESKKVNGRSVQFIPNGIEHIDTSMYCNYRNASVDYEKLNISKGNYILFASGRLDRIKGLHHLLEVYSAGHLNQQLVIIADFSHNKAYNNEIEEKLQSLSHHNIVVIKQLLPKCDLFDVIIHSKLVVFPSEIEAMSMFLLEVLACNKTVVCSDIEGNTNIVGKHYKYLFRSKDVGSLTEAIGAAMTDISKYQPGCYNLQTKNSMTDKYNWKDIVTHYSTLYKSFLL